MSNDNHNACIIDHHDVMLDESKFDTFNDLGLVVKQIIQSLLSNLGVTSVTLVFDLYDCEISIKQLERDRRTGRGTTRHYGISGRRKPTGPDNIPASVLNEHADCLAAPLGVFLIVHCAREFLPMCGSLLIYC